MIEGSQVHEPLVKKICIHVGNESIRNALVVAKYCFPKCIKIMLGNVSYFDRFVPLILAVDRI